MMTSTPSALGWRLAVPVMILSCAVLPCLSQVSPEEIRDPRLKALENTHLPELRAANREIVRLHFPYAFVLSRYVGLDLKQQPGADTRGLELVKFHDRAVLKVTGNYNAAYNARLLSGNQRAGRVVEEVISPILSVLCRELAPGEDFSSLGFEISFHVRRRDPGYDFEGKEILVLLIERQDAEAYVKSTDPSERREILERSEVYLNGKPYGLALGERDPYPVSGEPDASRTVAAKPTAGMVKAPTPVVQVAPPVPPRARSEAFAVLPQVRIDRALPLPGSPAAPPAAAKAKSPELPQPTEASPDVLQQIQNSLQVVLDRLVPELESQGHFVRYAPPSFISFHHGVYLQLSLTTTLPPSAGGSQYRQSAFAFDQHIAHLIRPVLAYFKDHRGFDGIDFSTTIRLTSGKDAAGSPLAVEFIFPLKLLNAYAAFDSTGQQLIDSGFVLINGERVSLNLVAAEAGSTAQ